MLTMAHDVFISHSHEDKTAADAVCAALEAKGIRCWIAPRDINPGQDWASSIVQAIQGAQIVLLVFSRHANESDQVKREVDCAANSRKVLLPLRIDDVLPEASLKFYLGTPHWLDAITPPFEAHLEKLAAACSSLLAVTGRSPQDAASSITGLAPSPGITAEPAGDRDIPAADQGTATSDPAPVVATRPTEQPSAGVSGEASESNAPYATFAAATPPAVEPSVSLQPPKQGNVSTPEGDRDPTTAVSPDQPLIPDTAPSQGFYGATTVFDGRRPSEPPTPEPARQQPDDRNLAATQQRPTDWPPGPRARPADKPPAATPSDGDVDWPAYAVDQRSARRADAVPHPPRQPAPPPKPLARRLTRRTKFAILAGAVVLVAVIATGVGIGVFAGHHSSQSSSSTEHIPASPWVALPFTDLRFPIGVAVDTAGTVYVIGATDANDVVLKLPAGATASTRLPFPDLKFAGVAVDTAGTVYVTEAESNVVLKLPTGATAPVAVPFAGMDTPGGVAVDTAGAIYVAGGFHGQPRVLKQAAGQSNPTVLVVPYASPGGMAVDTAGNLYVTTDGSGLWKLPAGATTFISLHTASATGAVAVDAAGNVYFVDENDEVVVKLPAGAATPTKLPPTGTVSHASMDAPRGLAVDAAGNIYVADTYNNWVAKLAAG
jgi:hypothetical protein